MLLWKLFKETRYRAVCASLGWDQIRFDPLKWLQGMDTITWTYEQYRAIQYNKPATNTTFVKLFVRTGSKERTNIRYISQYNAIRCNCTTKYSLVNDPSWINTKVLTKIERQILQKSCLYWMVIVLDCIVQLLFFMLSIPCSLYLMANIIYRRKCNKVSHSMAEFMRYSKMKLTLIFLFQFYTNRHTSSE